MEVQPQPGNSPANSRARKPILTRRKPGIEKLISAIPCDVPDMDDLRRFAMNATAAASSWQVDRVKADNALARRVKGGR